MVSLVPQLSMVNERKEEFKDNSDYRLNLSRQPREIDHQTCFCIRLNPINGHPRKIF